MTSLFNLTATTPGLPCRTAPDPEIFFSKSSSEREQAKGLCRACPIRTACAQYALDRPSLRGVWGGTTAADRKSFHTGQPCRFDEQGRLRLVCGSEKAYRAHFAYREQPCDECRAAHEADVTAGRRARLEAEHAAGGSSKGFWIHRSLGEPPCPGCRAKWTEQQRPAWQRRGAGRGSTGARGASVAPGATEVLSGAPGGAQPVPAAA